MTLRPFASPTFRSDRSWTFDAGVRDIWDRIGAVDQFESWWPWLRRFDPAGGMVTGSSWRCEVSPPLPYVVRFVIRLDRVDPARRIDATVSGDIGGRARLHLDGDDATCTARLVSELHPTNPLLRGFGIIARPMVEYGHDWVLDAGQRQFTRRALGGREV